MTKDEVARGLPVRGLRLATMYLEAEARLLCLTDHDCPRPGPGRPSVPMGLVTFLSHTTGLDLPGAVERVENILRAGAHFPAGLLRNAVAHLGTTHHYGDFDGPGLDWAELQWWARRCPDEPWSGEGDFGGWLRIGALRGEDW